MSIFSDFSIFYAVYISSKHLKLFLTLPKGNNSNSLEHIQDRVVNTSGDPCKTFLVKCLECCTSSKTSIIFFSFLWLRSRTLLFSACPSTAYLKTNSLHSSMSMGARGRQKRSEEMNNSTDTFQISLPREPVFCMMAIRIRKVLPRCFSLTSLTVRKEDKQGRRLNRIQKKHISKHCLTLSSTNSRQLVK